VGVHGHQPQRTVTAGQQPGRGRSICLRQHALAWSWLARAWLARPWLARLEPGWPLLALPGLGSVTQTR
jgi:hypothetical protein